MADDATVGAGDQQRRDSRDGNRQHLRHDVVLRERRYHEIEPQEIREYDGCIKQHDIHQHHDPARNDDVGMTKKKTFNHNRYSLIANRLVSGFLI